ncbi:MAG: hypothetical protein AB7V18_01180 [Pyrinomonadaceae bacterium]
MPGGPKKKKKKTGIFSGIRKPTAPPAKKLGDEKAESKARPSLRKAKHKKKEDDRLDYGDL